MDRRGAAWRLVSWGLKEIWREDGDAKRAKGLVKEKLGENEVLSEGEARQKRDCVSKQNKTNPSIASADSLITTYVCIHIGIAPFQNASSSFNISTFSYNFSVASGSLDFFYILWIT